MSRVDSHIMHKSTILMVSDYHSPIGGVEQHIESVIDTLQQHGHWVYMVWLSLWWWVKYRRVRLLTIWTVICNVWMAVQVLYAIIVYKPQYIYRHNVHRFCGRLPIYCASWCNIKMCIMYHDLWYFCLYPSKITQESDIDTTFNRKHFVNQAKGIARIGAHLKYLHLKRLHYILRHCIDVHLVPSTYMVIYVQDIIKIPSRRIHTLALYLPSSWWSKW